MQDIKSTSAEQKELIQEQIIIVHTLNFITLNHKRITEEWERMRRKIAKSRTKKIYISHIQLLFL
jgi:hypothetical protein